MGKVTIREFNLDRDYETLIAVWEKSGLPYKPRGRDCREKIARELKRNCGFFLFAEADGETVGVVLGTHDGRKGWINRLAVLPEYRRQGIAQRLINAAEEQLHTLGIHIIACLIEEENQASMTLFEAMGYVKHHDIIYFSKRRHGDV